MIERFNYVSSWVATRICMTEKPRDRIKLVAKLINVAYQLKTLNNFNGLLAVTSGLNRSTSILVESFLTLLSTCLPSSSNFC